MTDYGPFGGNGGYLFDDAKIVGMDHLEIGEITIRTGQWIDSIEVLYRDRNTGRLVTTDHHGGYGGIEIKIDLHPREYIVEVRGRTGNYVDALTLQTSEGRVFGRYGGTGGGPDYDAPSQQEMNDNHEVFAFSGRSNQYLDAIGIHTRPRQR